MQYIAVLYSYYKMIALKLFNNENIIYGKFLISINREEVETYCRDYNI